MNFAKENNIPSFSCSNHPKELISRICIHSTCYSPVSCIDCIISESVECIKNHKDSLMTISSFIDYCPKSIKKLRELHSEEDAPPAEMFSHLENEEPFLMK